MRALDGWYAARFLGFFLRFEGFPFLSSFLHQPPVTQSRWAADDVEMLK
jgi:hypothetical protein